MIKFDIILDNIGYFEVAQIIIFLSLSWYRVYASFHALATVFIAYQQDFRCKLDEDIEDKFSNYSEQQVIKILLPTMN